MNKKISIYGFLSCCLVLDSQGADQTPSDMNDFPQWDQLALIALKIDGNTLTTSNKNNSFYYRTGGGKTKIDIQLPTAMESQRDQVLTFNVNQKNINLNGEFKVMTPEQFTNFPKFDPNTKVSDYKANIAKKYSSILKKYIWTTDTEIENLGIPQLYFIHKDEKHIVKYHDGFYQFNDRKERKTSYYINYKIGEFDDIYRHTFYTFDHEDLKTTIYKNIKYIDSNRNMFNVIAVIYNINKIKLQNIGVRGNNVDSYDISNDNYTVLIPENNSSIFVEEGLSEDDTNKYYMIDDNFSKERKSRFIYADGLGQYFATTRKEIKTYKQNFPEIFPEDPTTSPHWCTSDDTITLKVIEKKDCPVDFPKNARPSDDFRQGYYCLDTKTNNQTYQQSIQHWRTTDNFVSVEIPELIVDNDQIDNDQILIPNIKQSLESRNIVFDLSDIFDDYYNDNDYTALKDYIIKSSWVAVKRPSIQYDFDSGQDSALKWIKKLIKDLSSVELRLKGCIILEDIGNNIWKMKLAQSATNNYVTKKGNSKIFRNIDQLTDHSRFIKTKSVAEIILPLCDTLSAPDLRRLANCRVIKKIPLTSLDYYKMNSFLPEKSIDRIIGKLEGVREFDFSYSMMRLQAGCLNVISGFSQTICYQALKNNAETITRLNFQETFIKDPDIFINTLWYLKNLKDINTMGTDLGDHYKVELTRFLKGKSKQNLMTVRLSMPSGSDYIKAFNNIKRIKNLKTLELRHSDIDNKKIGIKNGIEAVNNKTVTFSNIKKNNSIIFTIK